MQGGSEVARLRQQIIDELTAADLGVRGFAAGAARHDFIEARMGRVGDLQAALGGLVGSDQAVKMVLDAYTSSI